MFWRKSLFIFLILIIFLVNGCSSDSNTEDKKETLKYNSIISPSLDLNEQYYRGVLPYKSSQIKGMLKNIPGRLDNKNFELGMLELAKNIYDPSKYIFQEGQILTIKDIELLFNESQYPQFKDFIYAINEHDYLLENGEYGGVVIGILVSPKYYLEDKNGEKSTKYYSEEEITEKSKQLISELIPIIRKTTDASLLFGVMKAQVLDYKLPGSLILSGNINKNEINIEKWIEIKESYLFLPTEKDLTGEQGDIAKVFNHFKNSMEEYLPGFAGITGIARFREDELTEVTLKIITEFDSTVETIQYAQFGISMISKYFPNQLHINLYINSIDKPKALYIRKADGEDFIHIYRD